MDTKVELEKVKKELDYYKHDYEAKMSDNKINSIKKCIDKFATYLKRKDFYVEVDNFKGIATSVDFKIYFYPKYDYKLEPRRERSFIIVIENIITQKRTEYLIGIFDNTPLPEPDFNKLIQNPYKGMSIDEIELKEKKKDLKYYKDFISETESGKNWVYQSANITENKDLGLDSDLNELYQKIYCP